LHQFGHREHGRIPVIEQRAHQIVAPHVFAAGERVLKVVLHRDDAVCPPAERLLIARPLEQQQQVTAPAMEVLCTVALDPQHLSNDSDRQRPGECADDLDLTFAAKCVDQ
jgi:hypothetical protein